MRIAPINSAVIFLTVTAALLWTPVSARAFSPWTGQIVANINLRTAPGLHGQVITGIDRGAMVEVRARQGDWYQIERQTDTFGYVGWVYAKYVVADPSAGQAVPRSQPAETRPLSAPAAAPETRQDSASPVLAAPGPPPEAIQPPMDPLRAAPRLTAGTGTVSQAAPAKSPDTALSSPSPREITGGQPPPTPSPSTVPMAVADRLPATQIPVACTMAQLPAAVEPIMAFDPESSAPESPPAETATMMAPAAAPYAGPRALVGLALRLTTVIFSCMALILAFRAFRIARQTAAQAAITAMGPVDRASG